MIARQKVRETVLYYTPVKKEYETRLKGVLVRMGIRIRQVVPDQVHETVGSLLGFSGWNTGEVEQGVGQSGIKEEENDAQDCQITEEILVMHNFSGRRMDELLQNLRKAGVPKIDLKAVVTETNSRWSFYHLYEEIREEHEKMTKE